MLAALVAIALAGPPLVEKPPIGTSLQFATRHQGLVTAVVGSDYTLTLTNGDEMWGHIENAVGDDVRFRPFAGDPFTIRTEELAELHPGDTRTDPSKVAEAPSNPAPDPEPTVAPTATVKYDRFKDETTIIGDSEVALDSIPFVVTSTTPGRKLGPASRAVISFVVDDYDIHEMIFLVDGRRISVALDGTRYPTGFIPISTLKAIGSAKKAELQVGAREGQVTATTKAVLRDFVRQIPAPKKK